MTSAPGQVADRVRRARMSGVLDRIARSHRPARTRRHCTADAVAGAGDQDALPRKSKALIKLLTQAAALSSSILSSSLRMSASTSWRSRRKAGSSMTSRVRSGGKAAAPPCPSDPGRPGREDDDAVGQEHRLVDVVGDEDHGLALDLPAARAAGAATAPGSGRRAHRRARPSAAPAGRRRACGRWPPAGACRRRSG